MTTPERDRVTAAFDDELAGASLPPGFREELVHAAVQRPQAHAGEGYPRALGVVAALLAMAIVATLVFIARQPHTAPVKPRPVIPVAGIAFNAIAMYGDDGWGLTDTALLTTADGAQTWTNVTPAISKADAVVGYYPLDARRVWLETVGTDIKARVWITADGGQTWSSAQVSVTLAMPRALIYTDGTHGWIAGPGQPATQFEQQGIVIASTVDGGKTWHVVSQTNYPPDSSTPGSPPLQCGKQQISFLNATTGWLTGACGGGITFDMTTDGGKTWKVPALPSPDGKSWPADCGGGYCSLSAPRFVSPTFGYMLLFDYDSIRDAHRTTLYVTVDGGKTWDTRAVPGGDTDVRMVDAFNGLAAAGGGATPTWLYRTADGGHTWQPVNADIALQAVVLDCISASQCWALSPGGASNQLFKTLDGGATWTDLSGTPPSPSPSPSPSGMYNGTWSIGFVTAIAVSPEAVYALYVPKGTQGTMEGAANTMLARVDRATGQVRTAGPFAGALTIAISGTSVWIGHGSVSDAATNSIIQVDGTTLNQLREIVLPLYGNARIVALAGAGNLVWVAYGSTLFELDGIDGKRLASVPVPGVATSLAIDPTRTRLYAGSDVCGPNSSGLITEWDSTTLRKIASAGTGGGCLGGPDVSAGKDGVWVSFATGMLGQIEHRAAGDLRLVPLISSEHSNAIRVYAVVQMVWSSDANGFACLDPSAGRVKASWPGSTTVVIAGDDQGVYLGDDAGLHRLQVDQRCQ